MIEQDDERAAALVYFMSFLRARIHSTQHVPFNDPFSGPVAQNEEAVPIDWVLRREEMQGWICEPESHNHIIDQRALFGVRLTNISRLACASVILMGSGGFGIVHPRVAAELNVLRGWCIYELMLCGFDVPYITDTDALEDEARVQSSLLHHN